MAVEVSRAAGAASAAAATRMTIVEISARAGVGSSAAVSAEVISSAEAAASAGMILTPEVTIPAEGEISREALSEKEQSGAHCGRWNRPQCDPLCSFSESASLEVLLAHILAPDAAR